MRILFVSTLHDPGASGVQRLEVLRALGHDVRTLALDRFDTRGRLEVRFRARFLPSSTFRARDEAAMGRAFVDAVRNERPELVWVEKALLLKAEALAAARDGARGALLVCFQDDDPFGLRTHERPSWLNFVKAISSYDLHFVKREVNVDEFTRLGAPRVLLLMHGVYSPLFHVPTDPSAPRTREVVFAGTPYDHRVAVIHSLLAQHRLPLDVFGPRWNRSAAWRSHRARFHATVVDQDYADVLRSAKIALGFVSSSNRDEYSMRSFEIPACGAMLLAERTTAHQSLFKEGVEAEFFADAQECADKCRYYLAHDEARLRIAAAGHAKVSRPEHSLEARMRDALERAVKKG